MCTVGGRGRVIQRSLIRSVVLLLQYLLYFLPFDDLDKVNCVKCVTPRACSGFFLLVCLIKELKSLIHEDFRFNTETPPHHAVSLGRLNQYGNAKERIFDSLCSIKFP